MLGRTTASQSTYSIFAIKYKAKIAKDDDLTLSDKAIVDTYTKLITGFSDAKWTVTADRYGDLFMGLVNSANNSGMEFSSLSFQFKKDKATITLTIEPHKLEYGLDTFKQELVFRRNIRLMVDFFTLLAICVDSKKFDYGFSRIRLIIFIIYIKIKRWTSCFNI